MKKKMLALGMAMVVLLGMAVPVCAAESQDVVVNLIDKGAYDDGSRDSAVAIEVTWEDCSISIAKRDCIIKTWNPETLSYDIENVYATEYYIQDEDVFLTVTNRSDIKVGISANFTLAEDLKDIGFEPKFSGLEEDTILEAATEGNVGGSVRLSSSFYGLKSAGLKNIYNIISNRTNGDTKLGTFTISVK